MVNGVLFLLASRDAENASNVEAEQAQLAGGSYLVKAYVDLKRRIEDDPTLMLGAEDFVGQAEFTKTRWREGFKFGVTVPANKLSAN